jgi:hypothetical protein
MRLILYLLLAKAVLWIAASFWPGEEAEPAFIGAAVAPAQSEAAGDDGAVPARDPPRQRPA